VSDIRIDFIVVPSGYNTADGENPTVTTNGNITVVWYDPLTSAPNYNASFRYQAYTKIDANTAICVFEHGDTDSSTSGSGPQSDWPYMIRVRYRVHDAGAKISGSDGYPGRLFEQLLYVNRE
jgi:hypothetical protein